MNYYENKFEYGDEGKELYVCGKMAVPHDHKISNAFTKKAIELLTQKGFTNVVSRTFRSNVSDPHDEPYMKLRYINREWVEA